VLSTPVLSRGGKAAGATSATSHTMEAWLAGRGLDAALILPQMEEWGISAVDELSFLEEFDIEGCCALPLIVKRKLIAAIAAITGVVPYSDRPASTFGAAEPEPTAAEGGDCSVPGGAVAQPERPPAPGLPVAGWKASDPELITSAAYSAQCQVDGIPFRPNGLFPPGDPQLIALAAQSGFFPFQKHCFRASDETWALSDSSFVVGAAAAAERGIDLRYFYSPSEQVLRGVVRLGAKAMIADPDMMSAHGGAVEAILDEATAELMKIQHSPNTVTRKFTAGILKPVVPFETLTIECRMLKQASGGANPTAHTLAAPLDTKEVSAHGTSTDACPRWLRCKLCRATSDG
jgi:hypothetical protein